MWINIANLCAKKKNNSKRKREKIILIYNGTTTVDILYNHVYILYVPVIHTVFVTAPFMRDLLFTSTTYKSYMAYYGYISITLLHVYTQLNIILW